MKVAMNAPYFALNRTKAVLGLATALSACAGSQMALPLNMASQVPVLLVTERSSFGGALVDKSFHLGKYQVVDVDRNWSRTRGSEIGGYSNKSTVGGYSFTLKYGAQMLTAECTTGASRQKVEHEFSSSLSVSKSFDQHVTFHCHCGSSSKIDLAVKDDTHYGEMTIGKSQYKVSSTDETNEGSRLFSGLPTGYIIDGVTGTGAVEAIRPGRVWLSGSLRGENEVQVACLAAALILYVPENASN